jgi:DNA-binding Lrp family transcriptional regulator
MTRPSGTDADGRRLFSFRRESVADEPCSDMDSLDKKILSLIQDDFPIVSRPYAAIGEKVGCSENEAFRRVMAMKKAGVIRRIGANFDSRRLGFVSTLVGMQVPPQHLERVASLVSSYPQVTHNYERNDDTNLWFTVIAQSRQELERIVREIASRTPEARVLNLPAKKVFKLKVRFEPIHDQGRPTPRK